MTHADERAQAGGGEGWAVVVFVCRLVIFPAIKCQASLSLLLLFNTRTQRALLGKRTFLNLKGICEILTHTECVVVVFKDKINLYKSARREKGKALFLKCCLLIAPSKK